jgi:hypothetical protein
MRPIVVIAMLLAAAVSARAQIADPEQRKSWFNLQKLAADIEELNRCFAVLTTRDNRTVELPNYYARIEEFVSEVDEYVRKYVDRRGKEESPAVFRFRVWQVSLNAGAQQARRPDVSFCKAMSQQ